MFRWAVEERDWEQVKVLVKGGEDIDQRNWNGTTALMEAARKGNLDGVGYLIEIGADINAIDMYRRTALIRATQRDDNLSVVQFLVKCGANVNATTSLGGTSLMYAVENGRMEIVKFLVESGADVNALISGGKTSLMYAAQNGRMKIVKFLVENEADVNALISGGKTPLMYAAQNGSLKIIKFLVENGADVNVCDRSGKSSLMYAVKSGSMKIIKFLVKSGADVTVSDRLGETSLTYAFKSGNMRIVMFLVESGADVNVSDRSGKMSLMYAVKSGSMKIIKSLVESGADVNAADNDGLTVLLYASQIKQFFDIVQFLVTAGADINASDNRNKTPLIEAANNRNLNLVKLLVNNGAEINAADKNGWTAVMYATQCGDLVVVQFLLDNGAAVSIVNNDGRTVIFIATSHGYTDIERLLMQNIPHEHQRVGNGFSQMPDHCFISSFEVKLLGFIGSVNGGRNYRAFWLDAEVVVKLFVPEASATTFAHEVTVWHQLRHPNVIKLYGACDIGHHFFVCEWTSTGSLVEYLDAREKRGERRMPWKFLYEAALGLAYLHERKIIHDFQVSGSTTARFSSGRPDVGYGSYCWQAPERLKGEAISFASDIYSFGLCVIAAVTGEIPWNGCLYDSDKNEKKLWDEGDIREWWNNRAFHLPVKRMTENLSTLAFKMCSNDPCSRVSPSEVVQMLEKLAVQESKTQQPSESKPELIHISQYKDGELLRKWQKLQDVASNVAVDQPELAVFRELETLYERLSAEHRPEVLLKQFYKLITDCIGAIDVGSHQYRILRLSSTNAQGRSMTGIYRRIDTIWAAIDDSHSTKKLKVYREKLRQRQQDAFVSEVSQTLVVLEELDTDEARNAFVAFLKNEIDSHGSSYTTAQMKVLEKAYTDLNARLKSDAVATMPKWFLPWFELEIDGANYLAEGAFGEVYRAKWLESEVIVKQVKLTNSNSSDSEANHSLSASLSSSIHIVEKTRKQMREMFEKEVDVWFGLSHPHVVRLFGACHVGTPLFACEYASNGSLDKYLRKYPNEIWQKLHEAALGVQYLHSRNIIHCDLKCNNVVVGGDNKAKVTDFGLSSANVVTGAWHWVAPECLERGHSELSTASDIYAFGMCIVEALRIVEIATTKKKDSVSLPRGNLENNVVKYYVAQRKMLPSRPKCCTDDEWGLVQRMCVHDRSERIKISTVVDELAAFANIDISQTPKVAEIESVRLAQAEINKMKRLYCLEQQDQPETSSTNQVVLRSVYGLLWDRLQDLCATHSVESGCLRPLFDHARINTTKLKQCPDTLNGFTEMAMNGYALHRELDKVIDANFCHVDSTSGGLHNWKSKCKAAVCTPGSVSLPHENDEQ